MSDTATVQITIAVGDIWRDPDGIPWRIAAIDGHTVRLERRDTVEVQAFELARRWRDTGPRGWTEG